MEVAHLNSAGRRVSLLRVRNTSVTLLRHFLPLKSTPVTTLCCKSTGFEGDLACSRVKIVNSTAEGFPLRGTYSTFREHQPRL